MSLPIPDELAGTTQALFYEFRHQSTSSVKPPYNLKDKDWKGTKSMYLLYMEYDTEYDAALALLGSWPHWEKLCKTKWFAQHKEKWDAERKLRDESLARKTLLEQAKDGNVTAAKAILAKETQRGRPKNKQVVAKDDSKEIDDMYERMHVIRGGKE